MDIKDKIKLIKRSRYNTYIFDLENLLNNIEILECKNDIYFIKDDTCIFEYNNTHNTFFLIYKVIGRAMQYNIDEQLGIELFKELLYENKNGYFTIIKDKLETSPITIGRMMSKNQVLKLKEEIKHKSKYSFIKRILKFKL